MKAKNHDDVGTICLHVRTELESGNRLDAIRIVRSWLVRTGRGDSFTRAVNIVNDVKANEVWIRRSIAKVKGAR